MDVEEYLKCRRSMVGLKLNPWSAWMPDSTSANTASSLNSPLEFPQVSGVSLGTDKALSDDVLNLLSSLDNTCGLVEEDERGKQLRFFHVQERSRMADADLSSSERRSQEILMFHSTSLMNYEDTRSWNLRSLLRSMSRDSTNAMSLEEFNACAMRKERREWRCMIREDMAAHQSSFYVLTEQARHCLEDAYRCVRRTQMLVERRDMVSEDLHGAIDRRSLFHAVVAVQSWWRCFMVRRSYKLVSYVAISIQTKFRRNKVIRAMTPKHTTPPRMGPSIGSDPPSDPFIDYMSGLLMLDQEYITNCDDVLRDYNELHNDEELLITAISIEEEDTESERKQSEVLPVYENEQKTHEITESTEETEAAEECMNAYIQINASTKRRRGAMIRRSSVWH